MDPEGGIYDGLAGLLEARGRPRCVDKIKANLCHQLWLSADDPNADIIPFVSVFFTADTHFGDHRTINIARRPFANTAAMDEELIERWNAVVGIGDTVWHLGDVARRPADVAGLLARLNGTKHLLRGNNDPDATLAADGWASTGDYAEVEVDDRRLVLCHYPFRSWNGQHRGALNLHGHSHGRLKPMPRQFDVGVDVHNFSPVLLENLFESS